MKKELHIYFNGRLVAIQNVSTWSMIKVESFIKVQVELLGRAVEVKEIK